VAVIDAKGNLQTREYDPLGRVVRVSEPDGNLRELEYDPEGNVVHARDKLHDVRFTYRGMGRLASRTEAGTTVGFSYDTEEQLRAITNEHGSVYAFELGATGQVQVERGFDGIRRQYVRDKAGRVTKVFRPAGLETEYAYDAGGRVVAVKHSDGSAEGYAYRADGELVEAKNDGGTVSFERDILGRVVREAVGDDWVASDYDALGMRARIRSSKGLDQRIQRNAVGQMIGVRATTPADEGTGPSRPKSRPGEAIWEATVRRDALGLEIERTCPAASRAAGTETTSDVP
jgi:YD repeat-containing protein